MAELTIDADYLRLLTVKVKSVMAKEETVMPDGGSNFTDDALPPESLQMEDDDLTREELVEEIRGMSPEEQAELVALMWLGRDDKDAQEWDELVKQARNRREVPTEAYLLDHPLLAEYWLEGLERLEAAA